MNRYTKICMNIVNSTLLTNNRQEEGNLHFPKVEYFVTCKI